MEEAQVHSDQRIERERPKLDWLQKLGLLLFIIFLVLK